MGDQALPEGAVRQSGRMARSQPDDQQHDLQLPRALAVPPASDAEVQGTRLRWRTRQAGLSLEVRRSDGVVPRRNEAQAQSALMDPKLPIRSLDYTVVFA